MRTNSFPKFLTPAGAVLCLGLTPWAAADTDTPTAADSSLPTFNPDRPGVADGSTLVGPQKFQIETGIQTERHQDGDSHTRLTYTPTLLRYGLNSRYEVRIETLGYQQSRDSAPGTPTLTTAGYSPVSLGVKFHFQDSKPSTHNLSLGAILRVFPASGSSDFQTHHVTTDLRLTADWTLSSLWSVNPNVGVGFYEDSTGKTFTSFLLPITVTYNVTPQLAVFAEPALQTPEQESGGTSLLYDGGVTYIFGENTQVDFSVGTGVSGQTPPHPFFGAGVSHRF